MYHSAYDLKSFYNSLNGRVTQRVLREHLETLWPDTKDLRILGYGYALPFLSPFLEKAERVCAVMPAGQGAHHWPADDKNLTCLTDDGNLPFETNSVDRIVLVHALEFSVSVPPLFEELWRVLKSNGRLMIIVPNRLGLWARATWSPYGLGTPYSSLQVEHLLRENMFVHERTHNALFVPPFRKTFFLRSAGFFEKFGRYILPGLGGINFVEASKQLYAGTGTGLKARQGAREATPVTDPLPVRREAEL